MQLRQKVNIRLTVYMSLCMSLANLCRRFLVAKPNQAVLCVLFVTCTGSTVNAGQKKCMWCLSTYLGFLLSFSCTLCITRRLHPASFFLYDPLLLFFHLLLLHTLTRRHYASTDAKTSCSLSNWTSPTLKAWGSTNRWTGRQMHNDMHQRKAPLNNKDI